MRWCSMKCKRRRSLYHPSRLRQWRRKSGATHGARVVYTPADHDKAANLHKSRGFDLVGPKENFLRGKAPRGGFEKSGAQRVSDDLVTVVPMAMPDLRLPPGNMLALSSRAAHDLSYEDLLVCENLEPLLQLHTHEWLAELTRGRATLALFRGAPGYYGVSLSLPRIMGGESIVAGDQPASRNADFIRACSRPGIPSSAATAGQVLTIA